MLPMPSCNTDVSTASAPVRARTAPHPPIRRSVVPSPRVLSVEWARTQDDVRDAQRLRYRVFALEMGARLSPPPGSPPGLDVDRFDAFCDHLLVRAGRGRDGGGREIVGTYRVLSPERARAAGGYYTDSEFDLAPLAALRPRTVELGRSCVHADWRMGGVILAMWSALAGYMVRHGADIMIGCASVSLHQGVPPALALWQQLRRTHLADARWRVQPWHGLPGGTSESAGTDVAATSLAADAPPLLKGYLRCGARVLGPPALDAAFHTADLPMMLRLQDMAPRYRRHLLAGA